MSILTHRFWRRARIKNRGYLVFHNRGQDLQAGRIRLNAWLGLERADRLRITQLYPHHSDFGVRSWEEDLVIPVGQGQTLLLQVEPTNDALRAEPIPIPASTTTQKAFVDLDEAAALIVGTASRWPAAALPGSANTPRF